MTYDSKRCRFRYKRNGNQAQSREGILGDVCSTQVTHINRLSSQRRRRGFS